MKEYRVVWKRVGQARRRKIYQTLKAAEDFMRWLGSDDETPLPEGDYEREVAERMCAPFTENPTLESREVGEWGVVS